MLMGKPAEALKWGQLGIGSKFDGLTFDALAGPYSRWLSVDAFRGPVTTRHTHAMAQLLERLNEFDALDQIELVIGNRILGRARGNVTEAPGPGLPERLAAMPSAVWAQLQRVYPVPISGFVNP
jgi:hypothetical protein